MKRLKCTPQLRFPSFHEEWKGKKVEEVMTFINGKGHEKHIDTNGDYIVVNSKFIATHGEVRKYTNQLLCPLYENDIVMVMSDVPNGKALAKCYYIDKNNTFSLNQRICALNSKINSNKFLFYQIDRNKYFLKFDTGYTQTNLRKDEILKAPLFIPSLAEQKKIASFLSAVDKCIELLQKKKDLLEDYKKGVMQQLFSQQLRFQDEKGNEFPDWEERKLNEVLFEHKTRSSGNEEVFSVSVHKGLINQIEHLGRSFAAKNTDHYNLVKNGDIVYTKSPTGDFPYGIIKQSHVDESVIVSPLYGVFTPETYSLGYILHVFFESKINVHNYLHSIIQKGAKNTINITNTTFLSKKMKLPIDKNEQKKIALFLMAIDSKIETTSQQIEGMQTFKKGLLQQMFV